jgi:hypothetical protein
MFRAWFARPRHGLRRGLQAKEEEEEEALIPNLVPTPASLNSLLVLYNMKYSGIGT